MTNPKIKPFLLLSALFFSFQGLFAQENKVLQKFNEYRENNYQEKIYVTTDREFFIVGEIIWFKVYNLEATQHLKSTLSKVAYVELLSNDSTSHLQAKIELENGVGQGSFYIPTSLKSGNYILRGYTNWMKNYDAGFYFQKEVSIVNTFRGLALSDQQENFEIRFFPEGGYLVDGLKSRIAFHGISSTGIGKTFNGWVLNQENDTVATFSPEHHGMGDFTFTPDIGDEYKAVVSINDKTATFTLPEVMEKGFTFSIEQSGESIHAIVESNLTDGDVQILVQNKNRICYTERKYTGNGKVSFSFPKVKLLDGINHFTLFDRNNKPVCERLYFKYPENENGIKIIENKSTFHKNEKVSFGINSTLNSDLSVAVFKLDSLNSAPKVNILSYLYLLSELKGKIENPTEYFEGKADNRKTDLLMLTHGWSRFSWDDVLSNKSRYKKFVPEVRGHLITGRITDTRTRQTSERIISYLSVTDNQRRYLNSISDRFGEAKFEMVDFYGNHTLYAGFNNTTDSTFRISINNPFSTAYYFTPFSGLSLDENLKNNITSRSISMQTLNVYHKNEMNTYSNHPLDTVLFYDKGLQVYKLDDYTRFTTMEDVMREYVPNVWVRKNSNEFYFRVMDPERELVYKRSPLILYDGLPVFKEDEIMKVDPLRVGRLDVVSTRYFLGKQTFDGIVSYSSYKQNADGFAVDPSVLMVEYEGYQEKRCFYSPTMEVIQDKNLPNSRNLLYWSPDIKIGNSKEVEINFYASDEVGRYLIVTEGISEEGVPGYTTATFEVKD